jgi:SPP1 family predicted phage head-tail adaptor
MDAGTLDRRVTHLKRRLQALGGGEQQEVFDAGESIWVKVEPLTGREYFAAAQLYQEETLRFLMRFRRDLSEKDRLDYQGKQYNITHMGEIGRREGLTVIGVAAPH